METQALLEFAWVTILSREQDIIPACILVRSLKRVQTVHQCVAIVLSVGGRNNEWINKCSGPLNESRFDKVVTAALGKTESELVSVQEIINLPEVRRTLDGYKYYALLPFDALALKNPDILLKQFRKNETSFKEENIADVLVDRLKTCWLISRQNDAKPVSTIDTLIYTLPCNGFNANQKCLEDLPLFVRLPGLTLDNLDTALDSTSGLYELGIIKYWREHHNLATSCVNRYANFENDTCIPFPIDFEASLLQRPLHCIALQAENSIQFDKLVQKLQLVLSDKSGIKDSTSFPDLCYTLNTKLAVSIKPCENLGEATRAIILAKDAIEASKILQEGNYLKENVNLKKGNRKICFMFTGQGCQYPEMGRILYETCPVFRLSLDRCNLLLKNIYGFDIKQIIFENCDKLGKTVYSQIAIFCVEYALLQTWLSWGVKPDVVVGHSLGEFCAAVAAGALEVEDALKLVAERSKLIDLLPEGRMLVLKAGKTQVENLMEEFSKFNPGFWLDFASINSKEQSVVSGDIKWINEFGKFAKTKGIVNLELDAAHAFHSRHMDPILENLRTVAKTLKGNLLATNCKYVSGLTGNLVDYKLDAEYWARHSRESVNFLKACETLKNLDCEIFVECGPQPVLVNLAKTNLISEMGKVEVGKMQFLPSLKKGADDWKIILTALGKIWTTGVCTIDWQGFDKLYTRKSLSINL